MLFLKNIVIAYSLLYFAYIDYILYIDLKRDFEFDDDFRG